MQHLWTPPSGQGKTSGTPWRVVGCCHLSGLCAAIDRRPAWEFAERVQIKVAYSKYGVAAWLSRSRLADCCAMSSFRSPYASVAAAGLRRCGRSPVRAALDQQGPNDAGHLVGQGGGDQHAWLTRQHSRQPRARRGPTPTSPADHRTGTQDQQSPDGPLTPLRDGSELVLAACRLLQRRQPKPGGKVPPGAGTRAVIAVAAIGPMPGIVMSRRATGSALARRAISPSSSLICSSKALSVLISTCRIPRALSGTDDFGSSTSATRLSTCAGPCGTTWPYSARCPRKALMHCVRCRTSRSRARNTTVFACCASSFTGTKRIPGRCAASQIASASATSFFCRLTKGFT